MGDCIQCFACNGILSGYTSDDVLSHLHVFWFGRKCSFVRLTYDAEFIAKWNEEYKLFNQMKLNESEYLQRTILQASAVASNGSRRYMQSPTFGDEITCVLCASDRREVLFLPCRHVVACLSCSMKCNKKCPYCRCNIETFKCIIIV